MRIQHNIMAMNAYRNYTNNVSAMKKNLERLSSGYKINRAGDDAAGLAISEKMRAQITGLETAQKNAKDGISLVQTAEGALTEVHDMLNRMVELATQSANGTYDNTTDRYQLQKEMDQLRDEINRIADSANFNGIKLLDGKSLSGDLSELGITYDTVSRVDGINIGDVTNGGGTKAEYTIDIAKMFSEGDTLELQIDSTDASGSPTSTTVTFAYSKDGATYAANQTTFKGNSAEEQAKDLAARMAIDSNIGANFDITVDGTKITLTAKNEGTDGVPVIGKVTPTGTSIVEFEAAATHSTPGTANSAGALYEGAFELMGGSDPSEEAGALQAGDKLTFQFLDALGNTLEVELTIDKKWITNDAKTTMENIVKHLNEAHFKDIEETDGIDESTLKVSDLFELKANRDETDANDVYGSIYVKSKVYGNDDGNMSAVKVTLDRGGAKHEINAIEGTSAEASAGAKDKWEVTATSIAHNFTKGDKVKLEGVLGDGRKFELELEAGVDFDIIDTESTHAANIKKTLDEMKKALNGEGKYAGKLQLKVTDADGNVSNIAAEDFFGEKGDYEAKLDGSGNLVFEARSEGLAVEGQYSGVASITKISCEALDDADAEFDWTPADAKTAAKSVIELDSNLSYGSAVKVGDHVYEIVADSRDTSSRNNTAVVVSDPTDAKAVAKALAEAIAKNEPNYTVKASNGTVTIESNDIGSDQKALSVTFPYGDGVTSASFKFNPSVVKEGSLLTFNGQQYEFVKTGNAPTKSGAIAIEVDDFAKADAKSLAEAFKNVLNNGTAEIADDGTITLHGLEVEGKIENASVQFENSLVLQIGDTADSYNQLKVNLSDMHTTAMGINGISIADQESAAGAIDAIRAAINYVSDVRGTLGATQNRLDHTINNLSVMTENIQDAESTIRDTDIAEEMMAYTKNNILIQSAQAMLAQANQVPQGVLQLLQ